MTDQLWPVAIDPIDCACTECLTGEHLPLNEAFNADIRRMIRGEIRDNTGEDWTTSFHTRFEVHGRLVREWREDHDILARLEALTRQGIERAKADLAHQREVMALILAEEAKGKNAYLIDEQDGPNWTVNSAWQAFHQGSTGHVRFWSFNEPGKAKQHQSVMCIDCGLRWTHQSWVEGFVKLQDQVKDQVESVDEPGPETSSALCQICYWTASGPWSAKAGSMHTKTTGHFPIHLTDGLMTKPELPCPYVTTIFSCQLIKDHEKEEHFDIKSGRWWRGGYVNGPEGKMQ